MEKTIIYYHKGCPDGQTAAWFLKKYVYNYSDLQGLDHAKPDPQYEDEYDIRIFVDYCPQNISAAAKKSDVLLIDHHKTTEKYINNLPSNVKVILDMNHSAAFLAAQYALADTKDIPKWVYDIEDIDLGKYERPNSQSTYLAFTMAVQEQSFYTDITIFSAAPYADLLYQGHIARKYKDILVKETISRTRYKNILGYNNIPIVECQYFLCSDVGKEICKGVPFSATFYIKDDTAIISLRSDQDGVDVSKVAEKYGGGGHVRASGLRLPAQDMV